MATYLDAILTHHRKENLSRHPDLDALAEQALGGAPTRDFREALQSRAAQVGIAVIAEIKRRSPSKGNLSLGLDPAELAKTYERGGASCLSVLTDSPHFGGSVDDLVTARASCSIPVLRKDFTVSVADIYETRIMGADAILLIVAALDDNELEEFHDLALSLGLDVLVEVHDEPELKRALAVGADIIGVNQRDLHTFEVDHDRARRVGALIPANVVRVAESGIANSHDVASLVEAGYEAVLVGEALVTSEDPIAELDELIGGARTLHEKMS